MIPYGVTGSSDHDPPLYLSGAKFNRMLQIRIRLWQLRQRIDFRRHNEIIAVETTYFVGPQSNGHAPPFGQDRGMMSLFLGQGADTIREREGIGKICKAERSFQPLDTFPLQ